MNLSISFINKKKRDTHLGLLRSDGQKPASFTKSILCVEQKHKKNISNLPESR